MIRTQISICSLIGGLSVVCTQGLGSSILTSIRGDNQFKHWCVAMSYVDTGELG